MITSSTPYPASGETGADTSALDLPPVPDALSNARWMGWRLRLLVAAALLGSFGLFFVARWLAEQPHVDANWVGDGAGRVVLSRTSQPELQPYQGRVLTGVGNGPSKPVAVDALALERSTRWLVGDAERARHAAMHDKLDAVLVQPSVRFHFADGLAVDVPTVPRGYGGLGAMFWTLCGMALLLYLVAQVVLLARPSGRNLLYAVITLCESGSLLFIALESALELGMPAGFPAWDLQARMIFDLVSCAAIVHVVTLHPTRLHYSRLIAGLAWAAAAVLIGLGLTEQISHAWWWTQAAMIGAGSVAIVLLTRSYRIEPHPFAMLMQRFGLVGLGTLVLLTAAIAAAGGTPGIQRTIASVGSVVWYGFFALLMLLIPLLSRSQQMMREFSLLAGVSTVATSLDLLFVAVFSFGQFASLALSLFLALGVYAGVRQWMLNQLLGSSVFTAERMFEQLYRVAREVEMHPESVAKQLARMLRELFEPLEVNIIDKSSTEARVIAHGSTLLVPVPDLMLMQPDNGPPPARAIVIRFAHRGRRLFTVDDARLTDRIVEQLRRAIAFDKAVEQGRSEERARLAQDLHDDIGARLLTLMYKAPTPEMEDYVRHTLQDLKTLTRGLAAPSHRLSHAAAEWKADLTQRLSVAHIELAWIVSFDEDAMLSVVQWSGLTRVMRELVSNAIAHAQASLVSVEFTLEGDQLDLVISDNGVGRNPRAWAHGLGLGGVRKRVKQLGGEVEWVEVAPHGIACKVRIRGLFQRR